MSDKSKDEKTWATREDITLKAVYKGQKIIGFPAKSIFNGYDWCLRKNSDAPDFELKVDGKIKYATRINLFNCDIVEIFSESKIGNKKKAG